MQGYSLIFKVVVATYFSSILPVYEANAQSENKYLIHNKTIKFGDVKMRGSLGAPGGPTLDVDYVDVDFSDSLLRNYIIQLKYQDWMSLLSGDSTSYAADLILTDIFGFNVHNKPIIDDYEDWAIDFRKKDQKFWKSYLKKSENFQKIAKTVRENKSIEDRYLNKELQGE